MKTAPTIVNADILPFSIGVLEKALYPGNFDSNSSGQHDILANEEKT